MRFGRRIIGGRAVVGGRRPFRGNFISAPRSWTYSPTDDLIGLMRKSLGFHSAVTAALLILCSASGSNAEPDAAIEHAPEPVEAAQGPNITVVPDRDTNVSTAQTENDAAKIIPSVSIAPANTSCDTLNSAAATHGLPIEFFARLIRQESNFDPKSVSNAGAQGIAQFMPGTARWRGLSDPFEPTEALWYFVRVAESSQQRANQLCSRLASVGGSCLVSRN
jgi:hypothetical protein